VNTRTRGKDGHIVIAEAVGDFTLRNGNKVVCIRQSDETLPKQVMMTPKPRPMLLGVADSKQRVLAAKPIFSVPIAFDYPHSKGRRR